MNDGTVFESVTQCYSVPTQSAYNPEGAPPLITKLIRLAELLTVGAVSA